MSATIDRLRGLIGGPRDGALLRLGLAQALLDAGDAAAAVQSARDALGFDPDYSAAWKLLGKALTESGQRDAAITAYTDGINAAERRGDVQAGKEMRVFRRRLETMLKAPFGST